MHIIVGSDHAGYALKKHIIRHIEQNYTTDILHDVGADSEDSVDYPDYGYAVARDVVKYEGALGIVVCGSGIGISIAANRVAGARAALCTGVDMARLAREHNDANILALGARLIAPELALACVDTFLTTLFEGGRHEQRVKKLG
ncbi:MAG: ribose 5-phosphate isomerase B [Alphaproteobacteria bacterium]|nr:MAG: ribose 5-phosphate isomerase B [Alphaproteobacteria bacterium]TAF39316.1 MAG: ribose 5-phosphate isomerase B [Alphaproteobacteria bacterium]TAF74998.1 MAG: ribose 5-phosphate isomerase B [Alphaproteobacteria bacterium]